METHLHIQDTYSYLVFYAAGILTTQKLFTTTKLSVHENATFVEHPKSRQITELYPNTSFNLSIGFEDTADDLCYRYGVIQFTCETDTTY